MRDDRWSKDEFNGYLNSLRYICDKKGIDFFTLNNECKLNRVQKLYNSSLHGSNYILPVLWTDNFDEHLNELIEKNKSVHNLQERYNENKKILYNQLKKARKDYCGLGTSKVKLLLNKLIQSDRMAQIVRITLEIEDLSIVAKNSYGDFAKYRYYEKQNLIEELMELCDLEGITYGYKDSDIPSMKSIIFFDMPFQQISWHTNIDKDEKLIYDKQWDGLECSTLGKLEQYIKENYL